MMRVLFPDISNPSSGRGFFLNALAKELPNHGVEVAFVDGDHDVSLHSIRMWRKTKKPRILRLDGCYHDTAKDYKSKNDSLAEHAKAADGIVCQSEFSKQMVMKFLGIPEEKIQVIFNGAEQRNKGQPYDKNLFVTASRWRPHKRLNDIVESFYIADIPGSILMVCGDMTKSMYSVKDNGLGRVRYLNHYDHDDLYYLFELACASIHLCWFDACPNSAVESIVAGCPVITNNVGGTHEIVRPSGGIVLDLDSPYDYSPVDLYNPPAIDRYVVAEAMRKCAQSRPVIKSDHVLISTIAKQYKEYFERFC